MNGALAVLEQMSFEEFMEAVAERVAGKIHPLEKGLTMTKPEVAKEMGFSEATLMRMGDARTFPAPVRHRSGGKCFWKRAEVEAFAGKRGTK